jgi:uncharacterized tellurite resistance protein B-like protein
LAACPLATARVDISKGGVVRSYAKNSPEAMARIIALIVLSDADLNDAEVDMMDRLGIYGRLGVSRKVFIQVVKEYFDDLLVDDTGDRIRMLDPKRLDVVLDCVDDDKKRIDLAAMMLSLISADGDMNDAELATLRHVLFHWGLTLDQIEANLPLT